MNNPDTTNNLNESVESGQPTTGSTMTQVSEAQPKLLMQVANAFASATKWIIPMSCRRMYCKSDNEPLMGLHQWTTLIRTWAYVTVSAMKDDAIVINGITYYPDQYEFPGILCNISEFSSIYESSDAKFRCKPIFELKLDDFLNAEEIEKVRNEKTGIVLTPIQLKELIAENLPVDDIPGWKAASLSLKKRTALELKYFLTEEGHLAVSDGDGNGLDEHLAQLFGIVLTNRHDEFFVTLSAYSDEEMREWLKFTLLDKKI